MKDQPIYPHIIYEWLLPLFRSLSENNIRITPDKHIDLLKVFERFEPQLTSENLIDFIAPVLAKNAEQLNFIRKAYADFISSQIGQEKPFVLNDGTKENQRRFKKYVAYGAVLVIATIGLIVLFKIFSSIQKVSPTQNVSATIEANYSDVKHPVRFSAVNSLTNLEDTTLIRFKWNFGDGHVDSSGYRVNHVYANCGNYRVQLELSSISDKIKIIKGDTNIFLAIKAPAVEIVANASTNIEAGQEIQMNLRYDSLFPPSTQNTWYVNDTVVAVNTLQLRRAFDYAGTQRVHFVSDTSTQCSRDAELTLVLTNPEKVKRQSKFTVITAQTGEEIKVPRRVHAAWNWGLAVAGIVPIIIVAALQIRNKRQDARLDKKIQTLIRKFDGRDPPLEVPFADHEELIENEVALLDVAKSFKRRMTDDVVLLNISKTIASTIRMDGMINFVWGSRTRPVEFLVLIENTNIKSQRVRLFDHLLKKLQMNDVYIEKFYFNFSPDVSFNSLYPTGIRTSELFDLYPNHVVIILGTGYQFIDPHYPSLDDSLIQLFKKWNQFVICTPISFKDWSYKEEILQQATVILPVDLAGLRILFQSLSSGNRNYVESLAKIETYSIKGLDFSNIQDIQNYLNDPFLFQWLCAVAVYPRLEWNVMIALGDTIRNNYPGRSVNYTALLKLVRIPWMHDGSFPDGMRLQLLKNLEPKNEKVARETMIKLMNDAAIKISEDSHSFEELEIQRLTDKFLLYASNPDEKRYKTFKNSHDDFKDLWKAGKIYDYPLKKYLVKDSNDGSWSTLVDNRNLSNIPGESKSIDTLLDSWSEINFQQKVFAVMLSLLFFSCLFILNRFNDRLNESSIGSIFYHDLPDYQFPLSFQFAFNDCVDSARALVDSVLFEILLPGGQKKALDVNNRFFSTRLTYSQLRDSLVEWRLMSTRLRAETALTINRREILFSITGCPDTGCSRWTVVSDTSILRIVTRLSGAYFDPLFLKGEAPNYYATSIDSKGIDGYAIEEISQCEEKKDRLRVIVKEPNGLFQVIFLREKEPGVLGFDFVNKDYRYTAQAKSDIVTPEFKDKIRLSFTSTPQIVRANTVTSNQGVWLGESNEDTLLLDANGLSFRNEKFEINNVQSYEINSSASIYRIALRSRQDRTQNVLHFVSLSNSKLLIDEIVSVERGDNVGNLQTLKRAQRTGVTSTREPPKPELAAEVSLPDLTHGTWQGGTSKRILMIAEGQMYYSLNATSERRFKIEKTFLMKDGVYKVVLVPLTGAAKPYNVFLIKNISQRSLELSVCEGTYSSLDEIEKIDASYCDHFNVMSPFNVVTKPMDEPLKEEPKKSPVEPSVSPVDLLGSYRGAFKQEQLENPRVRSAYDEKATAVKDLFDSKKVSIEGFNLFIRAFKFEQKLEVWVKPKNQNSYVLLSAYNFCAPSGILGPKRKEGDGQVPEGIYSIVTFNPVSRRLSLVINYPNQADLVFADKTSPGGYIAITGGCETTGNIPITDDKINELYVLAVEATNNGQRAIPVHIFPSEFNVNSIDRKKYGKATLELWRSLQTIYEDFEKTKVLRSVWVDKNGRYTFKRPKEDNDKRPKEDNEIIKK